MPQCPHLSACFEQHIERTRSLDTTVIQHKNLVSAAQDGATV
jgi:hypothetical protein